METITLLIQLDRATFFTLFPKGDWLIDPDTMIAKHNAYNLSLEFIRPGHYQERYDIFNLAVDLISACAHKPPENYCAAEKNPVVVAFLSEEYLLER
jgi:hypothetical protein